MNTNTDFWWWLIAGGGLFAMELFTGTFYLLFFSISAVLTAGVAYIEPRILPQVGVFAMFCFLSSLYIQKKGLKSKSKGFEADVAQLVRVESPIKAQSSGTVNYQGSPWSAHNQSSQDLKSGDTAKIVKTEGNKLIIEKVEG